jgi:hypothetical protein
MRPPIGRLSRRDAETDPSNERTELIQVAKLEFAVVTDFDHETRAGAKSTTSAGSAQTGITAIDLANRPSSRGTSKSPNCAFAPDISIGDLRNSSNGPLPGVQFAGDKTMQTSHFCWVSQLDAIRKQIGCFPVGPDADCRWFKGEPHDAQPDRQDFFALTSAGRPSDPGSTEVVTT